MNLTKSFKGYFFFLVAIFIIGGIVYMNSLTNGFVWDDQVQVVENSLVRSLTNVPNFFTGSTFYQPESGEFIGTFYRPIMMLYFSLIGSVFGLNPFIFHLIQVIIHIGSSCLVFLFLNKFFRKKLSFFLALVFLVHPVNVETVSYVSGSQDALFFFFGILALYLATKSWKSNLLILFIGLFALLSILSKETGVSFLIIIPLYSFLFMRSKLKKYVVLAIVLAVISLGIRLGVGHITYTDSKVFPMFQLTLWQRLLNVPSILVFYLKNFIFPKDLAIAWNWTVTQISFTNFFPPLLVVLAVGSLLFFWGSHIRNSQRFKVYLFFTVWLAIGLGIHLQIIPLDMTAADRWFYLPMVGLLGLIGLLLEALDSKHNPAIFITLAAFIITLFSIRTIVRNFDWKDSLTLYNHDINISKDSYSLENGLASQLFYHGDITLAEIHMKRSLQLNPNNYMALGNMGLMLEMAGKYDDAINYYQKSLEHGASPQIYERLASLLLLKRVPETVLHVLEHGVNKYPRDSRLWLLLALTYYQLDNHDKALFAANKAYQLSQNSQTKEVLEDLETNKPIKIAH